MSICIFKTETTGLPQRQKPLADLGQPRMVQLAAVLFSPQWDEINMMHAVIKPDGWVSNAGAMASHGIPLRRNELYGARQKTALAFFMDFVRGSGELASWMLNFDGFVIDVEMNRINAKSEDWSRGGLKRTSISDLACSKWKNGAPMKMAEAHLLATGETYEKTHRALDDVRAAARILKEIRSK